MITLACTNQKGGTGKTTTAINLAAGMARKGVRVLLIDLDPQGNSTNGLGVERESIKHTIGDVLDNIVPIKDAILKTKIDGLDVVPSLLDVETVEQKMLLVSFRESLLSKTMTDSTMQSYDYCVIDCKPTLGVLTVNAIFAGDYFIVPCSVGRYALDGVSRLMKTIITVKGDHYEMDKNVKILLTNYDMRNKVTNEWAFAELEPYNHFLLQTRIRKNEAINQSQIAAEPIYSYDINSLGAADYAALTDEIMGIFPIKTIKQSTGGK